MALSDLLLDPRNLGPILLTLRVLLVAGGILLCCGVPLAYFLSGRTSPMRSVADFLITIPLVFPPIATGFLLLLAFGRSGIVGRYLPVDIVFAFPGWLWPQCCRASRC